MVVAGVCWVEVGNSSLLPHPSSDLVQIGQEGLGFFCFVATDDSSVIDKRLAVYCVAAIVDAGSPPHMGEWLLH